MMFVLMTGMAVGANGVESLLFLRVGPGALPYLYMLLGLATLVTFGAVSTAVGRSAPGRIGIVAPAVVGGVVLAMRSLLVVSMSWAYPVLWVTMMIAWTLSVLAAWSLAGAVHETRQAKRLFPLYGSGLILGTVTGGVITGPLASLLGTENLLVVWAGTSVVAFLLARSAVAGRPPVGRLRRRTGGPWSQLLGGYRAVRSSSLLRWMAVSLTLLALLYFSLGFVFARAATSRFPEADRLAGFLGLFMGVANGAALLVSLLVANRLFARAGTVTMVAVLPVIYLAGFGVLAVTSSFAPVVAFRFVQMTWVNGVWAPGWQALFNVVPPERRDRVRTFMDAVPLQMGIVASGALLVLADRVLSPGDVALAGVAVAAVATAAAWRARRAYAGAVVDALRVGNPEVFFADEEPFGGFRRDATALSEAVRGTGDPDPAVRRVSMEIVAQVGAPEGRAALQRGLRDEDPSVRAAALKGMARLGDRGAVPEIVPSLSHPDGAVRSAAVEAAAACARPDERRGLLTAALSDPDPSVRARAAVLGERYDVLEAMAASPQATWRAVAVAGLGDLGRAAGVVVALADPDDRVRRTAVSTLARSGAEADLEPLVTMLDDPDPRVRGSAIDALATASWEGGVVALRSFARTRARRALADAALLRTLEADGDPRTGLVAHALRHRVVANAIEAFRSASRGDPAAVRQAVEDLARRDLEQRANALETLEALGDREVVRPLLSVWEQSSVGGGDAGDALLRLLKDDDRWVRACAAFAASRSRDSGIRAELARLARSDADRLVREVAGSALEGDSVETLSRLSLMERVVFLRQVPLFAELTPADLEHIAAIATENVWPDGEVVARQGEAGEEMFVVVEGTIRILVTRDGSEPVEVARRGAGDYVGEMAAISREPRMGTLVCAGDVRALTIDRPRLERILRERPEASLAMMRVLCSRLRESHLAPGGA
jgi:HEAT repeat protein